MNHRVGLLLKYTFGIHSPLPSLPPLHASPAVLAFHSKHHALLAHVADLGQPRFGGEPVGGGHRKTLVWLGDQSLDRGGPLGNRATRSHPRATGALSQGRGGTPRPTVCLRAFRVPSHNVILAKIPKSVWSRMPALWQPPSRLQVRIPSDSCHRNRSNGHSHGWQMRYRHGYPLLCVCSSKRLRAARGIEMCRWLTMQSTVQLHHWTP